MQINGVDVGRMSMEKAIRTVNLYGNNHVVLRDHEVRMTHVGNTNYVDYNQINTYFKEQYEPLGSSKSWNFAPKKLMPQYKALAKLNDSTISIYIGDKLYQINPSEAFDDIHITDGHFVYGEPEGLRNLVNKINQEKGTLHKQFQFTMPDNAKVNLQYQSYGWQIDEAKMESTVETAFNHFHKNINIQDCLKGPEKGDKGTGYGNTDNFGLGANFILVSLKQQRLWVFKDNEPVATVDIVSGTTNGDTNTDTPTGVWYITKKQKDVDIQRQGNNSVAKRWMAFTKDDKAISDADWRNDWSNTSYQDGNTGGSINIRPEDIEQIWNNVSENEPVVITNDD